MRHSDSSSRAVAHPPADRLLLGLGLLLTAAAIGLAWLAQAFHYHAPLTQRPTVALILLLSGMGLAWLTLLWLVPRCTPRTGLAATLILLGVVMRLAQWTAPPVQEDDFYRYLWDGAVVAEGITPYAEPPAQAASDLALLPLWRAWPETRPADPRRLRLAQLADNSGEVIQRVAYPQLTTIYPPVAQTAFAGAHALTPFSLTAWRLVLLLAELLGLWLLWHLLRNAGDNPLWSLLYWWNPVMVVELANSAHMDALLVPLLLAALLAGGRRHIWLAAVALGTAAAVKLWPLVLAPCLRIAQTHLRTALAAALLCLAITALLLLPQLQYLTTPDNGLLAYSQHWQRNAFAYPWIERALAPFVKTEAAQGTLARLSVAAAAGLVAFAAFCQPARDTVGVARRWGWVIAALFLLSPTGYPWYYAWLLPVLCVWRQPALLALTPLLPLYYARFPLEAAGQWRLLEAVITIEFLPVWLALGWYGWRHLRLRTVLGGHA